MLVSTNREGQSTGSEGSLGLRMIGSTQKMGESHRWPPQAGASKGKGSMRLGCKGSITLHLKKEAPSQKITKTHVE